MNIQEAKEIQELGEAGAICVLSPTHRSEASGRPCSIQKVSGGWVTIRASGADLNVRAAHLATLPDARARGWR